MEGTVHTMTHLFEQLGLPSAPADIQAFIETHRPLSAALPLQEAPFWSPVQATFLREEVLDDADWALIIDKLDAALRHPAHP